MPYEKERANKITHADFVNNPDVQAFLGSCEYMTPPSESEAHDLINVFSAPPLLETPNPIEFILAIDGSNYESSIYNTMPNTRLGYLKIGSILFSLEEFSQLNEGRYVDPFKVAAIRDNNTALSFTLPSANIRFKGKASVRDGFRAALDEQLMSERTRFNPKDFHTSLRSTLFYLASLRPGGMGTSNYAKLKLHKCPSCGEGPVEVEDVLDEQHCTFCGKPVYPSDCLRIWEEVSEYQSNQTPLSRLMMVLEHLIPIHYIRHIEQKALPSLSKLAIFLDGPLAIYGTSAWLHRSIMIYLHKVNAELAKYDQPPILVIGLQKTGQIADFLHLIDRFLPNNQLYAIDDEYRYRYILVNRDASKGGFGFETYYGQDFIYKTSSGKTFVFALPYPFDSKEGLESDFAKEKIDWSRYRTLPVAIRLLEELQTELYNDAVVPIALAHRYTSISVRPGGRVLDLLTQRSLT